MAQIWPARWDEFPTTHGRTYQFPVLPLGFFGRVMVRLLQVPGLVGLCFWRDGIVVEFNSQLGLISYDPHQLSCSVIVRLRQNEPPKEMLLRYIVDTIDTALEMSYAGRGAFTKLIPCPHCLRKGVSKPFQFTYKECVQAIMERRKCLFCCHIETPSRAVPLHQLAPDLAFADLPVIRANAVELKEEIGRGGFGLVYRALIYGHEVAVKELSITADSTNANEVYSEFQQEAYIMRYCNMRPLSLSLSLSLSRMQKPLTHLS